MVTERKLKNQNKTNKDLGVKHIISMKFNESKQDWNLNNSLWLERNRISNKEDDLEWMDEKIKDSGSCRKVQRLTWQREN